jgi:hypothetical protein
LYIHEATISGDAHVSSDQVAACPTCRQPKLNPVIPNRALIQLLENSPELQQASGPATEPAYSFYDPEPDQFEENDSKQLRKRMVKRIRLQAIAPLVSENVLKVKINQSTVFQSYQHYRGITIARLSIACKIETYNS